MASVTKRTTTRGVRYDVRWRLGDGTARTQTFRTRREADRHATTVEADRIRGVLIDPRSGEVALGVFARRWLAERPTLRPRTVEVYEAQLRHHVFPTFEHRPIVSIAPGEIRSWHASLIQRGGLSPNTAAKVYRLVRTIFSTAVADEVIARNPCVLRGAGIERVAERPVATAAQVWEVASVVPERYRCLILLAGFMGLRQGELLGLERRHIDPLHARIRVEQQQQELRGGRVVLGPPKTAAGIRTVALPAFLVAELEHHLDMFSGIEPEARVFVGARGAPIRRANLHQWWDKARRATSLGSQFRFHDLRHTANTLAAGVGASTAELMARMGHASPAAALAYQHATEDRDATIAGLLGDAFEAARPDALDRAREGVVGAETPSSARWTRDGTAR